MSFFNIKINTSCFTVAIGLSFVKMNGLYIAKFDIYTFSSFVADIYKFKMLITTTGTLTIIIYRRKFSQRMKLSFASWS